MEKFGNGKLVDGFTFIPEAELTLQAAETFLSTFATQLCAADWVVRIHSDREKARYLLVYDILKTFLLYGRGKRLHLEATSVGELEKTQRDLHVAFEERLDPPRIPLAGDVEFVVRHGSRHGTEDGPIQMVVEVKRILSVQNTSDESTWQFYAELLAACAENAAQDESRKAEVFGCLTDAYAWQFYRADYSDQGWSIERAEQVILFQSGAQATNSTLQALKLFFTCLIPDAASLSAPDIHEAQQACDAELKYRAERYTHDALSNEKLAQENTLLRRELASLKGL